MLNLPQKPQSNIYAVICRLFDNMAHEWVEYKEPVYTKLDGMYGYLSVSKMSVYFFWFNHNSNIVCCDDISDRFKVEYVVS